MHMQELVYVHVFFICLRLQMPYAKVLLKFVLGGDVDMFNPYTNWDKFFIKSQKKTDNVASNSRNNL